MCYRPRENPTGDSAFDAEAPVFQKPTTHDYTAGPLQMTTERRINQ